MIPSGDPRAAREAVLQRNDQRIVEGREVEDRQDGEAQEREPPSGTRHNRSLAPISSEASPASRRMRCSFNAEG